MRIVWRDSREYKDVKYRGQIVSYLYGKGWVTACPVTITYITTLNQQRTP